jgi:hypothetical protein
MMLVDVDYESEVCNERVRLGLIDGRRSSTNTNTRPVTLTMAG